MEFKNKENACPNTSAFIKAFAFSQEECKTRNPTKAVPFNLSSEKRAQERKQFDLMVQEKERVELEKKKLAEITSKLVEEQDKREMHNPRILKKAICTIAKTKTNNKL